MKLSSMKSAGTFSLFILATALCALLLAGCGADEPKEQAEKAAPETPAAPAKVTLKLAFDADPVSLDPHVQLSGGMLQLSHMVFDPLVRYDSKDMHFVPRLAEKWERIDDLTMRFFLRKGVKFHSGNEFTAEDVAFTLDRLKKSDDYKGLFEPFVAANIIDPYTVDLVTSKPYGLVLNMATYLFPIDKKFYTGTDDKGKPKDLIIKTDYSFANDNESGTGPFAVTSREQGVKTVFTRFADYWDKSGNVEEIVLTPIKSDATRVAALLSGDVDFINPVPPQDLDHLGSAPDIKLVTMSGTRIITFQLNGERNPALKDPKVRLAMDYAYDNNGVVEKIMNNFATAAGQMSPASYVGHNPALTPRFDLEKAQALMAEAGMADGFEATMIAPNNRYVNDAQIAEAFVSMMSKINIKISLKTMPKAQYWDEYDAQAADIQMIGWHADTEDSGNFYEFLSMCRNAETGYGQYNSGNYCNAKVDELTLAAQTETDPAKRAAMLQEVEQIQSDEAGYIPLHWQNLSWASKKNMNTEEIVNVMDFPYFGDLIIQ
ncbi:MAG: ABC transporter substrate-binding protein [Pseudodesulfovibrio sp.]|uniref:Extracellular solute-binding protein family 5 n=1 Tax=Pseudodesulfovibrio aespoeensis (strain ATCC 700646 / DSM 10631 / Aspo-2) TaxID=643562 RepID=E6VRM1_PSEA9|nr:MULTISPECIES: ABC transporter substrate-binding protein [Pseudodesulfovibrio]MBU4380569.1 ABC transporter substrate-binding protein [Pseudomonadota bacterium]ADU63058.1 extracellular solute-binding protein family 5 [Pseudodesulfovibrio aespoeensis Aspo-2]MBU4475836.1 ABC transporter substrate-binding protein [Pseudomonadota bacterium]MBU4516674.1 ABC transporter substrate-binding protein [Pseudomonadota bacterium]MBU4522631.1 ABC transporter substrate-binding protein [Pseudomonadota bacteri